MYERNYFYYIYRDSIRTGSPDHNLQSKYKILRNKALNEIRKARSDYYSARIYENKNQSKNSWSIFSELVPTKHLWKTMTLKDLMSSLQPHKIVEGLTTDHENDIELNFVPSPDQTFELLPIEEEQAINLVNQLSTSNAIGADKLSRRMILSSIYIILPHLIALLNIILKTLVFPNLWKLAKVSAIYRAVD
jgi:hypothetical protein